MREISIGKKTVAREESNPLILEYFITVEEIKSHSGSFVCENYGLGILKTDGTRQEYRSVTGVTCSYREIAYYASRILKNQVTPVCLSEVLDDLIVAGTPNAAAR